MCLLKVQQRIQKTCISHVFLISHSFSFTCQPLYKGAKHFGKFNYYKPHLASPPFIQTKYTYYNQCQSKYEKPNPRRRIYHYQQQSHNNQQNRQQAWFPARSVRPVWRFTWVMWSFSIPKPNEHLEGSTFPLLIASCQTYLYKYSIQQAWKGESIFNLLKEQPSTTQI